MKEIKSYMVDVHFTYQYLIAVLSSYDTFSLPIKK